MNILELVSLIINGDKDEIYHENFEPMEEDEK